MKAYLYSRISTLQQVAGFGIARQVKTVQDFLSYAVLDEKLGYQLDPDDFELLESDLGKSAFHGRNWLPGASLGNFYKDVMERRITSGVLIVENIDRLTRLSQYNALEKLIGLINRGIDIIEVETGMAFSARIPDSVTMLNISVTRAHQESKRKSNMATKSWKNRIDNLVKDGKDNRGVLPAWLSLVDGKYVVDEGFTTITTLIHQLYSSGLGGSTIVRKLNAEGLTNFGKKWTTVSVHRVLRDRRLIGTMTVGKYRSSGVVEVYDNVYPCVIDLVLFNTVQTMLDSSDSTNKQRTTKRMRNIFRGLARCPVCGEAFICDVNGRKRLYYMCGGRRHLKNETCKGFVYGPVEKTLLKYLKGIDWAKVYSIDTDMSVINKLRNKLVLIETTISELESELKDAEDDSVLALVRVIKKRKAERDSINQELAGLSKEVSSVDVSFDLNNVCDQTNIELRQSANVELRKVVKSILLRRVDNVVVCILNYYTDIAMHYLVIDVSSGELINFASVDNSLVVRTNLMDVNLITGEKTIYAERANEWDQIVWDTLEEVFGAAFKRANSIIEERNQV
ncbi:recombinase family protein [Kluyvera intermedia]|uniref:recombinase family protein n=1 Tax=Kluyvera intermedia TaxID=61648 RepID=UPI001F278E3C|nr:recombinase family protein [Kluyvera intermedia]MCE9889903.1 recombinase family protein [Kluyvera intermedia]